MADVHTADIERRITEACRRSGRPREAVTLVAVTKTLEPDIINAALDAGLRDIGENRVQEYLRKCDALAEHRLHLIGHLQRNKVRMIINRCVMIHSVDSAELADEIDARAAAAGLRMDVLIEVNTSGEASKFGVQPADTEALARHVLVCPHVRLRGLMTIAAPEPEPERVRPSFIRLRALLDHLQRTFPQAPLTELSMGMSGDFEVAIEEGATLIRLGTALFGQRN